MSAGENYARLLAHLCALGRCSVAFSGGVDSTLLARASFDALGENALALTARGAMLSRREEADAKRFASLVGIRHEWIEIDAFAIAGFAENTRDRCYFCKHAIMTALLARAKQSDRFPLLEAGNTDDLGDVRPGMRAVEELGVKSPFLALGFGKEEIRAMSRHVGLPSADKPSFACLASRVPYGQRIMPDILKQIDAAEQALFSLGFSQIRVRYHGQIARIEAVEADMPLLLEARAAIDAALRALGFSFVCLDLRGYASGRLNEI